MMRVAVRVMAVTVLALAPSPAAAAAVTPPATGSAARSAARLDYFVSEDGLLEPGDALWFSIEGMPRGWDRVTVTSPALVEPVTLTPRHKGATQSRGTAEAGSHHVRSGLRAGSYPVTATSGGRVVATARIKVAAKGSAVIGRFDIRPKGASPGDASSAPVRPGGEVVVVLTDLRAAPGEDALTVTSPVFGAPLTIRTDSEDDPGCKCDDGATLYAGHTRLRHDVAQGRYPLTVVSHHGTQTTRRLVTVTGAPAGRGRSWMVPGAVLAGALALTAGAAAARLRRAHRATGAVKDR
ncbi:hypothetical protein AB0C59_19790 [Streptomyces sp. NPDC048664]|uniref:hypothetical protein n=1 Tax=Streptomyces sp. NPDC048664 TaxID=3154505 RepID=UPI00343C0808